MLVVAPCFLVALFAFLQCINALPAPVDLASQTLGLKWQMRHDPEPALYPDLPGTAEYGITESQTGSGSWIYNPSTLETLIGGRGNPGVLKLILDELQAEWRRHLSSKHESRQIEKMGHGRSSTRSVEVEQCEWLITLADRVVELFDLSVNPLAIFPDATQEACQTANHTDKN